MIEGFVGDIWRFHPHCWIVIPTNIGWTKDGKNVMGAGLAKQASRRYPSLPYEYGRELRVRMATDSIGVSIHHPRMIMFPVKPLNPESPHLSWRAGADPGLIRRSAEELSHIYTAEPFGSPICVPLVGCGNGGLAEKDVLPILRKHLKSDRFILVRYDGIVS